MEVVREISTQTPPLQLQEIFIVPCLFYSTGWGVRSISTGGVVGAMDFPPVQIIEAFSKAADQSKVWMTYFLKLPPVKIFQFALAVGLGIGITLILSQKNNCITPLPLA